MLPLTKRAFIFGVEEEKMGPHPGCLAESTLR